MYRNGDRVSDSDAGQSRTLHYFLIRLSRAPHRSVYISEKGLIVLIMCVMLIDNINASYEFTIIDIR